MASRWLKTHRGVALLVGAGLLALVAVIITLSFSSNAKPASANPATGFVSISAGQDFTCGLTSGGGVKCWGSNDYGQVGTGAASFTTQYVPADVVGLASGVTAISAESRHACALTSGGAVKCWGYNGFGQLGDGTTTDRASPVDVVGLSSGVTAIAVGSGHSCALMTAGSVMCWGGNLRGQLGDSTTTDRHAPVTVVGLSDQIAIAAGGAHSCAVSSQNGLKSWGYNANGQLGDGTTTDRATPVNVSGLTSGVSSVSAGVLHTCAIISGGLECWGYNSYGTLGNGSSTDSATPVAVQGLGSNVSAVAAGWLSTCALTSASAAKCWGSGVYGVDGAGNSSHVPVDVVGMQSGVVGITTQGPAQWDPGPHSCTVLADTTVWCWGANNRGQLGDGTVTSRRSPVEVLSVVKPTATPTPCPTDGCPTATPIPTRTPVPTPTPCPVPNCGLDFSIGTDLASGAGGTCDSSGTPTAKCSVPLDGKFRVSFYLNSLPSFATKGPSGYDAEILYSGVTFDAQSTQSVNQTYWPPCAKSASKPSDQQIHLVCGTDTGGETTPYVGRMATIEFTCAAGGVVTLQHGIGRTDVAYDSGTYAEAEGTSESLTINCVPPQAYPGDTDGDGCPDAREQGTNQMLGGRRNFLNPWDYFNPTHDGQNRVDDILAVVQHYGRNQGDAGYSTDYDRTYLGPNPWNLGPPNGQIRVDDILAIIKQFDQDCS